METIPDWQYWIKSKPTWSAREAACLLNSVEPRSTVAEEMFGESILADGIQVELRDKCLKTISQIDSWLKVGDIKHKGEMIDPHALLRLCAEKYLPVPEGLWSITPNLRKAGTGTQPTREKISIWTGKTVELSDAPDYDHYLSFGRWHFCDAVMLLCGIDSKDNEAVVFHDPLKVKILPNDTDILNRIKRTKDLIQSWISSKKYSGLSLTDGLDPIELLRIARGRDVDLPSRLQSEAEKLMSEEPAAIYQGTVLKNRDLDKEAFRNFAKGCWLTNPELRRTEVIKLAKAADIFKKFSYGDKILREWIDNPHDIDPRPSEKRTKPKKKMDFSSVPPEKS